MRAVAAILLIAASTAQETARTPDPLTTRIERAAATGIVGLSGLRAEKRDVAELVDAFCAAELPTDARDLARRTLFRGRHAGLEELWSGDPTRREARARAFGALGSDFLLDAWLAGDDATRSAVVAAAGHFAADRYSELLREHRAAALDDPRRAALESMAREMVRTVDRQPITGLVEALERDVPVDPFAPAREAAPTLLLLTHHPEALAPDLSRRARARLTVMRRELLATDQPLPIPLRKSLLESAPVDVAVAAANRGPLDATIRTLLLLQMQDVDPSPGLALLTASLWNPRDGLDPAARLDWIEACFEAVETAHTRVPASGPKLSDDDPIVRFVAAAVARDPEARVLTIQCADRIARAGDRAFATRLLARLDRADFVPGRDVPRVAGAIERMLRSDDTALAGAAASVAATLLCFRDFPPLHEALTERAIECLERRRGDHEWLSGLSGSRHVRVFCPEPLGEGLPGDVRLVEAAARVGGRSLVTPLLDLRQAFDDPTEPGAQLLILACLAGVAHHATGDEIDRLLGAVGPPIGAPRADSEVTAILAGLYCAVPSERLDEVTPRCRPRTAVLRSLGLLSHQLNDAQRQRVLRWISEEKSLPCFDELMLPETVARATEDGPLAEAARARLARTFTTIPTPILTLLRRGDLDPTVLLDHLDAVPWPTLADLARHLRDPALRDRFLTALAARLTTSEPDATSARLLSRVLPGFEALLASHRPTDPAPTDSAPWIDQLTNDRDRPIWDGATLTRVVDLTAHHDSSLRAAAYAALATRDAALYPEARLVDELRIGNGD